jgi:hypothetical protein
MKKLHLISAFCIGTLITTPVSAAIIDFHFTGKYTLVGGANPVVDQQSIESTFTFNSDTGFGSSANLTIEHFDTFGYTATIYDISLQQVAGTDLIIGNMLADWNVEVGVPLSMVWDARGLFNAIDYGLQAGDVISGTNLVRSGNTIFDVGSATPASDGLLFSGVPLNQGPAPLAVTTWNTTTLCTPYVDCNGNALSGGGPFIDDGIAGSPMIDGPFPGLNVNFDIGSGNSLTVLSVNSVPVPAAVWLFGSGLLGLVGMARRKKST